MKVIYEPKGGAKEYAELACNLYFGCTHGCRYCYAPSCMRKSEREWHQDARPRKDILKLFKEDAELMSREKDKRSILFSFVSDPYQPMEAECGITRKALQIACKYGLNTKVLTKGSLSLVQRDFDIMLRAHTQLGVTVCFTDDVMRREWEPDASPVSERFALLKQAHELGISTWVSLEPVINPYQALAVVKKAAPYVDLWKVGKINHMKSIEQLVDWKKFTCDIETLFKQLSAKYYIKNSLLKLRTGVSILQSVV